MSKSRLLGVVCKVSDRKTLSGETFCYPEKRLLSILRFVLRVTYCFVFLTRCWLPDNQLSWNVLLFFCNPAGQLCLSGSGYSSHTVTITCHKAGSINVALGIGHWAFGHKEKRKDLPEWPKTIDSQYPKQLLVNQLHTYYSFKNSSRYTFSFRDDYCGTITLWIRETINIGKRAFILSWYQQDYKTSTEIETFISME